MNTNNFVIIMHGPTGVGKTACADYVATQLPVEIVNADMGQFYEPLTIGTAKPDWRSLKVPHYLFDLIKMPEQFSVAKYRNAVKLVLHSIWANHRIPLIIGGSSYYVMALFFPPHPHAAHQDEQMSLLKSAESGDWRALYAIDPERAKAIHPSDAYRISRALALWQQHGVKPSVYKPVYNPIADYYFLWIIRDRDELYTRIDERVIQMMQAGWIKEVKTLQGTAWETFVRQKKIIGYGEIFSYLAGEISYDHMISLIQARTKKYAKRQITFWGMLEKKLENALAEADSMHQERCALETINLTNGSIERYSEQLKQTIRTLLS